MLISIITLALGGFLLHVRVHPIAKVPSIVIAYIAGILNIIVVPLLLLFKKTLSYGYVLNGMLAIIGTIVMAHFSIAYWPEQATPGSIIFETTLADILVLGTIFFIGKTYFELETFGYDPNKVKAGITYRYPNMGWWFVHLVALSIVYTLGNQLWR
jgi:hypothetical protein